MKHGADNIKSLIFAHATVRRMAIKREPGENPGQTRCCNPPLYRVRTIKPLTFFREGVRIRAVSQKTCLAVLITFRSLVD